MATTQDKSLATAPRRHETGRQRTPIGSTHATTCRFKCMSPPTFYEFVFRAALLGVALGIVALIERRVHRERATRWREYLFLLLCALAGGVFGVCTDAFTASASPEYFWLGKGVPDDDRFWPRVIELGFQAGFFAGAIIGGFLLVANSVNRHLPALPLPRLGRYVPWIMVTASVITTVAGLFIPKWDPLELREQMSRTLTPDELRRFMNVWNIHAGLYCGGGLGTLVACALIWRARKKAATP
ncbi:hypothetical protein PLCT1_01139 [Planctomycetaceae bacterium]|nr:hypothetical protein PLCT1_01139 [Planctomycetaceae bacterium]